MLRKIVILVLLILLSGCSSEYFAKNKEYYSKFKNPDLDYRWDFNKNLEDSGGETFNRTYFQIKKYNRFQEIFLLQIPYPIQYKHEEGHIYSLNLVNADNFDKEVYEVKCKKNLGTNDTVRNYSISIVEGVSDYYAITYFENANMTIGKEYLEYTKRNIYNSNQFMKYHIGFLFINYTISKQVYPNLQNFILNWCSKMQYNLFQQYVKTLN